MTVPSVRRDRNFLWLWAGQGVSILGEQFTALAIPVLAVTLLAANEWEVGVLGAAGTAAFLLVGLPAGAWIDRWRKRRVMIAADIVRAVALGTIPLMWALGVLDIWHLVAVAAVVGVATVFFDVAYQSYLPLLVLPEQVGPANSTLEATGQIARTAGPGLVGAMLTVITAPLLILADALSYVVSTIALWRIRDTEATPDPAERQSLGREIAEGVSFVVRQPLIRSIALTTATSNLFGALGATLLPLYVLRDLDLGPLGLGIIYSAGSVGGLLGALATPRLARWLGEGTVIPLSALLSGVALVGYPLAAGLAGPGALISMVVGEFVFVFAVLVYNISQVTMRQRLCPPRLLGRMNASIRFFVWGVLPLSALLAGGLGGTIGIVPTLWIAVVGSTAASVFVLLSPLLRMRVLPTSLETAP